MRIIRGFLYLFIIFVGIFFIFTLFNSDSQAAEEEALLEKHCAMDWNEMTFDSKKEALEEYINNNGLDQENRKPLAIVAYDLLSQSIKYPETIEFDGEKAKGFVSLGKSNGNITSVEDGTIDYYKNFTAKNKLNMDVRMQMAMKIKYTAGCKDFEVIDFTVQ